METISDWSLSLNSSILSDSEKEEEIIDKTPEKEIDLTRTFNFPYENPYVEQISLMSFLYDRLKKTDEIIVSKSSSSGVLLNNPQARMHLIESPTGTGKTLSLLWSLLSYYNDRKRKR